MTQALFAGVLTLFTLAQAEPPKAPKATHSQPYDRLFVTPKLEVVKPRGPAHVVPERRHHVERGPCNMPVVRARPEVDPRMVRPIDRRTHSTAKIRVIEPKICWEK